MIFTCQVGHLFFFPSLSLSLSFDCLSLYIIRGIQEGYRIHKKKLLNFNYFIFFWIAMEMAVIIGRLVSVFPAAVAVAVVAVFVHFYFYGAWRRTAEVRRKLREQGVGGPPPSVLYGNLPEMQKIQLQAAAVASPPHHATAIVAHDYTSTLFPYFVKWRKQYGKLLLLLLQI